MEHDNLYRVFVLGGLAAAAAVVLAVVLLALWIRGRRTGRHVAAVAVAFVISVAIAGLKIFR